MWRRHGVICKRPGYHRSKENSKHNHATVSRKLGEKVKHFLLRQNTTSHMNRHFQCAEQVKSPFKLSKYCACHAKWITSMILITNCVEQIISPSNLSKYCACHTKTLSSVTCVTYEMLFPIRGASKITLQPQQILCLPRKRNRILDPHHIWNFISNKRRK